MNQFHPHYDARLGQWVLIHADGPKRGVRVCVMDEEWFNRPVGLDPTTCGMVTDEKAPDGSDNYDVRFADEAGIRLWLGSLQIWDEVYSAAKIIFKTEADKLRRRLRNVA